MKNIITTAFILISLTATVSGQKPAPIAQEPAYTIDFVFTGQVQNGNDSLFTLQYSFAAADVQSFSELVLEDSREQHRLNLKKEGLQDDMEVKNEKGKVIALVHQYDKYDLPVPVQAEDNQATKHRLYLKTNAGGRITAEQLKAQLKSIRESEKQREKPDLKTNPVIKKSL